MWKEDKDIIRIVAGASLGGNINPILDSSPTADPFWHPSSLVGALGCLFDHPDMTYRIIRMSLLNEIKYLCQGMKHIKSRASKKPFDESDRTINNVAMLEDPKYLVEFKIVLNEKTDSSKFAKYREILYRRLDTRRYRANPYFGRMQYPAYFKRPTADDKPLNINFNISSLFIGWIYNSDGTKTPYFANDLPVRHGVLDIDAETAKIQSTPICFTEE